MSERWGESRGREGAALTYLKAQKHLQFARDLFGSCERRVNLLEPL